MSSKRRKKKDFFQELDYSLYTSITPLCKHAGDCGGCSFQHIAYDDQVNIKEAYLHSLFSKRVPVMKACSPFGYRNRMDFVYAYGKLGLRKKGEFNTVIEIENCELLPPVCKELYAKVKGLLKKYAIPSYDIQNQEGFLRYVVFRHAPSTGQSMLIFTSSPPQGNQEKQLRSLFSELQDVASLYWLINDTITDVSVPVVRPKFIQGHEHITEIIDGVSLLISPFSFFQANTVMAKAVFDVIKQHVSGQVVDLCCGVGTIALLVATRARSVTGIEEVEQSVALANKNKCSNGISNVLFFTAPMKKLLDVVPLEIDTLIVDPPRSGLEKKVVKKILSAQPQSIVYMSCNPKTQKIDIDMFLEDGSYILDSLQGWDMFPQTPHVETLVVLRQRVG